MPEEGGESRSGERMSKVGGRLELNLSRSTALCRDPPPPRNASPRMPSVPDPFLASLSSLLVISRDSLPRSSAAGIGARDGSQRAAEEAIACGREGTSESVGRGCRRRRALGNLNQLFAHLLSHSFSLSLSLSSLTPMLSLSLTTVHETKTKNK